MSQLAFLELCETDDGEVILRRHGDGPDAEPLVSVRFSTEARLLLGSRSSEIARAMVGAGVQMATYQIAHSDDGDDDSRVLH